MALAALDELMWAKSAAYWAPWSGSGVVIAVFVVVTVLRLLGV
jgi:hypothetical protein